MFFASRRPSFLPGFHVLVPLAAIAVLLFDGFAHGGNWPGWRGPTGAGYSEDKDLPLTWGGNDNANVLWKVSLPGQGQSSPIAWGDRVFVTSVARQTQEEIKKKAIPEHFLTCYQAADGKERWRTSVPSGSFADGGDFGGLRLYSLPTPVTDGKLVYAWFGSGVAVAVDFDGKIVWRTERPGPYHVYPGLTSSPLLYADTLLILVDQDKDSFLLALDKATGKVKWERKRPEIKGSANSSPVLIDVKGRKQLVVAGANALQALDPTDGKVLWWCDKDNGAWTSVTAGSRLVYTDSNGGRGVTVDPSGTGDVNKTHVKWQNPKVPEGLGSPIIVGDYLYRANNPGILKCWKLSTGELVFDKRLAGLTWLASPIATADGRIYFASAARSYVIKAGVPKLEVLAVNTLRDAGDEGPSPAVAGGRLFLKSTYHLWCIGKK